MSVIPWLNTGISGVEIKVAEFSVAGGRQALIIQSKSPLPSELVGKLSLLGFTAFGKTGLRMSRPGTTFRLKEMLSAFPDAFEVTVPSNSVWIRFEPKRNVISSTSPSRRVGGMRPKISVAPSVPVVARAEDNSSLPENSGDKLNVYTGESPVELRSSRSSSVNKFQDKYVPGSVLGKPIAMIPKNLSGATRIALDRVRNLYGDIDQFVASRLSWTVDELEQYLSPEQIDAVALELAAADRGQAFILADQTGLGKGRVVAAVARAAVLSGRVAVVVTEKPNLFSDLYRDISDINSVDLFGIPFILNDKNSDIVDTYSTERKVIFPSTKKKVVTDCLKSGTLPDGTKLVLSTYTQYNKVGSPKAEFLKAISAGQHVICDESHNAVGDSATSISISSATDVADSVMYSSATFAKNAKNLSAYKRLFPISMRSSDLMGVLTSGGHSISEALSQMLAEDGVYLRREQDLSDIKIEVLDDTSRIDRNSSFINYLSPILSQIAQISRGVQSLVEEKNTGASPGDEYRSKKASKETWYTGNFGSRLGVIVRQFITALLVDHAVDRCVYRLRIGHKPVVVIETTMESLMRELISDNGVESSFSGNEEASFEFDDSDDSGDNLLPVDRSPDFKDALHIMLDRTMQMMVRRAGEEEPERIPVEDPELLLLAAKVKSLINDFPDLSLSPIDDIKSRVEAKGRELFEAKKIEKPWIADEISARSMRVIDGQYVKVPAPDRLSVVAAFNAGHSDVLIVTRAGSTGLSLHSSSHVQDQRPRAMIEHQIAQNVVERMQFFGRVNRRGQVNTPTFETLSTGLPIQTRQLAVQNRKMADLSANVTASAASASAMDVPDMIDSIGNAICKRILEDRPSLADRMQIAMKLQDSEKAEAELYHVDKFLQRLVLLPANEQDKLYQEVLLAYEDALRELKARGRSPHGARELPGEWEVVSADVFEAGDPQDGPIFGRPVFVTTIQSYQQIDSWSAEDVVSAVQVGREKLSKCPGGRDNDPFAGYIKLITDARSRVLQASLPKRYLSVRLALSATEHNSVKEANSRLDYLVNLLRIIRPGYQLDMRNEDGVETGVILEIRPPNDPGESHLPGRWSIRYIVPGDEGVREISAATIIRDVSSRITAHVNSIPSSILLRYDQAPKGTTLVTRRILDGNLVRAVVASRHAGWGANATWYDSDGFPHRAILIPKNKENALHTLPGRITDPGLAAVLVLDNIDIMTDPDSEFGGAIIMRVDNSVEIQVAAGKVLKQFETDEIMSIVGRFRGDHKFKKATVSLDKVDNLFTALSAAGHAFHYEGKHRSTVASIIDEFYSLSTTQSPHL